LERDGRQLGRTRFEFRLPLSVGAKMQLVDVFEAHRLSQLARHDLINDTAAPNGSVVSLL